MNRKTFLKLMSVFLALIMTTPIFSGCGKKKPLLEDTILEDAVVVYVDNEPIIMRSQSKNPGTLGQSLADYCNGDHYRDITTGNIYHIPSNRTLVEGKERDVICPFVCAYSLPEETCIELITNKLTDEEIKKANKGEFTDADAIAVQQRLVKEAK